MKSYKKELEEFIEIYDYIDEAQNMLLYHSNIDRDEVFKILYDKAFFGKANHRLQEIFPFDWFDPDCGYDDDYLSWKSKLDDVAIEIKRMLREKEY